MLSESARMSSAAEARFRVAAPNSLPRATKIIALDARSEDIVRRLAQGGWSQASFFTASGGDGGRDGSSAMIRDLTGRPTEINDEVGAADQVIMIASPGGAAAAASTVGRACSLRRVMTTAFVIGATAASGDALSKTLAQVRPWSLMVVIAGNDDYIEDMLVALRA